jgi:hypothetical protein
MSYDLVFWKHNTASVISPQEIYDDLMDGRPVAALDSINIPAVIARVEQAFGKLDLDGGLATWEGHSRGMFEVYTSDQHVHFCCRQLRDEDVNTLIDILKEFQCCLFDPQVNHYFKGQ